MPKMPSNPLSQMNAKDTSERAKELARELSDLTPGDDLSKHLWRKKAQIIIQAALNAEKEAADNQAEAHRKERDEDFKD